MTQIIDLRPPKKIERGGSDDDTSKAFKPVPYKTGHSSQPLAVPADSDAEAAKKLTELIKDAHSAGPMSQRKHPIRDIRATDGVVGVDIEFCMIEWDLPMPKFSPHEAERRGYNVNDGSLDITVQGEVRATHPGFEDLRQLFNGERVNLEIETSGGLIVLRQCAFVEFVSSVGVGGVPEIDVEFTRSVPAHLL